MKSCFAGFAVLFLSIAVSGCGDSRTVITPAPGTERIVEKKVEMKEKDNGTIEVKEKTTKEIVK